MNLPKSALKVHDAAARLELPVSIRQMDDSTRTAEDAAAACGCTVAQIVKSLVFRGRETGPPCLLLVSGVNRVDEARAAEAAGEPLERPDARFVRDVTGFAIGGIPPFGHASEIAAYMDEDLLAFDEVWAAAGTPNCVMALRPDRLRDAIGATVIAVR
ncbi:YbaK/EbsC family protein [Kaustia mangrovi]|uniref:YbaK/EbsC family protein n=1 Tax=Kaustia mangrovi TaxID=2593653 RepID=A0A7S8HD90_9HYPH|nr:YbaK/EbsC family protein [Kaustia mangrovi]QPC44234.1 YbaK/EbsC family protein [Kaustia mangrovi]